MRLSRSEMDASRLLAQGARTSISPPPDRKPPRCWLAGCLAFIIVACLVLGYLLRNVGA